MNKKEKQVDHIKTKTFPPTGRSKPVGSPEKSHFSQHLMPLLLIAALSFAVYGSTLKNGFVYDDAVTIVKNSMIKNISNVSTLFDNKEYFLLSGEMTYRPIVTFSYLVDHALYDLKPWGYHLTNILLHAVNGVLCYIFLILLLRTLNQEQEQPRHWINTPPFFITLLFITHPVLSEAVNGISFREDLLVFVFYMITLNIYMYLKINSSISNRTIINILYLVSCIAYLFALLSKEMALTLPLIIYCYEWVKADSNKRFQFHGLLFERYNIGYFAVTVFYLLIRFYYFRNQVNGPAWEFVERLLSVPFLLVSYIKLLLFPIYLSADYTIVPVKSFFSLSFTLPFLILLTVLTAAYLMQTRDKLTTFGILFLIITLIPVYNEVPIANPFAERYLYLPILGHILILGSIAQLVMGIRFFEIKNIYVSTVVVVFISGIYVAIIIDRNTVWKNDFLLWSDTIKKMPNSSNGYINRGLAYKHFGKYQQAMDDFNKVINLYPGLAQPYINRGVVFYEIGRYRNAIEDCNKAIELYLPYTKAINSHGSVYFPYSEAYICRGSAYLKLGDVQKAVLDYSKAIDLDPLNSKSYNNRGVAYQTLGKYQQAINDYSKAIEIEPLYENAYSNRGYAYIDLGNIQMAIKDLSRAVELNPSNREALTTLSKIR